MNATQALRLWQKARRWSVSLAVLCVLVTVPVWAWSFFAGSAAPRLDFVPYTVTKSDLPIVVTERGSLESQIQTEVRCEVENSSMDRGGNYGTQIIFIVPNGSAVKKGDLLVELDSAGIRDKLDRQILDHQRAVSMHLQAKAKYENQKTQNETAAAEATLKLELAKLQLEVYMDPKMGEHQLAVEEIERTIDETRNLIEEAQAALALQKTEKLGIEALFKLGYRGKNDLDQSRFKLLQAEDKLAASVNRLSTNESTRQQLEKYSKKMKQLILQGDVETAQRNVKQVETDNESKLNQAIAANTEAEATANKEQERLEKLQSQLKKCKIFAPHNGMAVYAQMDRDEMQIGEGTSVRERQHIFSLPDLSQMQIKTRIHEAVLDQVVVGLPVTVRVDAFPNRTYVGVVERVAVVPTNNGWYGSSGVKTYDCIVRIPDKVENLKPGMTAVADIHIDRIRNVLAVPVQAVVQIEKDNWCYLIGPNGAEKKKVDLGRSNDKFVHVTGGLSLNDRVILNPMMLFDEEASASNEIAPDADAPETPKLPVEKIAEKTTKGKVTEPKKKRSGGPRPGKGAGEQPGGGGVTPSVPSV